MNRRQWMLTLLQRLFSEFEQTQPHQVDITVEKSTMEEVPRLFGLAAKALPTPTLAVLQVAVSTLQTVEEVFEKVPESEQLSVTAAEMLEQAARVEAARLSLVKPLVETNKIDATKDLHDDELDDLLERSRSALVRTEYLEPFQERLPLSYTQMSESRVSPSRSVGSLSPTNDLSVEPSYVKTVLDTVLSTICDVLFKTFNSSDLLVVEDNLPEDVSGLEDSEEEFFICPTDIQLDLYSAEAVEVDMRECEDEVLFMEEDFGYQRPPVPLQWPDERSCSPFIVDEYFVDPHVLETSNLMGVEVEGATFEKAGVVEDDIYFVEEENFVLEATVDLQQLMKLIEQQLMHSEERCVSPFTDENLLLKSIHSEVDLLTLDVHDHVTEPLACAQIHEADVYYYEEESTCVDVVCDLTQIMKMTQRDLLISEERAVSPVHDEAVFTEPLETDVEMFSIDAVDCVNAPLNQAKVEECDFYYYEEESYSVDVVCDLRQLVQLSAATVDECTIFTQDEECFSESTLEQTTTFEQRLESFEEQEEKVVEAPEDEYEMYSSGEETFTESTLEQKTTFEERHEAFQEQEEEIVAEVAVEQKSGFEAPEDEYEMYSSGEETFTESTLEQKTTFEERREAFQEQEEEIVAEVAVEQKSGFEAPEDEHEMYSSGEETFSESTLEQKTIFEQRRDQKLETHEEEVVGVDQKDGSARLQVPEEEFEMYSSGEETFDTWTVETYRVYVEKRHVEADVTFTRSKQLTTASQGICRLHSSLYVIGFYLATLCIARS